MSFASFYFGLDRKAKKGSCIKMEKKERSTFKGSLGFVLAAAGSAVGLGNIWRFSYLAARDGGGIFVITYIVLAITFGFTLLTTEIAIGRKTRQSPLTAYTKLNKKWKPLGVLSSVIPLLIMPYYCAIGGWVLKYFVVFLTGNGKKAADSSFFSAFIGDKYQPLIFMFIFLILCAFVVYKGVNKGIENSSKVIMPILLIMIIGIAIFSLTLKEVGDDGKLHTGLQGLKVFLIPNFKGVTLKSFFFIVVDALGQLFYSLSIAMGIMIAYGSYVPDEDNLSKSINQIEIFDTAVAILAGIMIIPAVYVFNGTDGMEAGPSLMFVSLPKIFSSMGKIGNSVGSVFFAMVLFAAATSAISIMEAIVASIMDRFKMSRRSATLTETIIALVIGMFVCLGYNILYFDITLPNGVHAQILDILDYISNYVLMPIVAIATCILIGWVMKAEYVIDEVTKNGEKFARRGLYKVMVKYIAPILLIILFTMSVGVLNLFS